MSLEDLAQALIKHFASGAGAVSKPVRQVLFRRRQSEKESVALAWHKES